MPATDRRVLFHVIENGCGTTHIGEYRERVFTQGAGMVFRSDACDVCANNLEFDSSQVWCWAYEPEIPT